MNEICCIDSLDGMMMEGVGGWGMKSSSFDILSLGDSLTEGYCHSGSRWHPYTLNLQHLLTENNYGVQVIV